MKRPILFLLLVFSGELNAQAFLEDPFLNLYLGKRANEYSYGNPHPYTNYAFSRAVFPQPFSGMQLSDNFSYSGFLNGKGALSRAMTFHPAQVYSYQASDRSMVNGGDLQLTRIKKAYQAFRGTFAHRWKNNEHENGWMEQPSRNDLNASLYYKVNPYGKTSYFECSALYLSERTVLQQQTNTVYDNLYLFSNRINMFQTSLKGYVALTGYDSKRHHHLIFNAHGLVLDQRAEVSVHRFRSDQNLLVGNVQYKTASRNGMGLNALLGAEFRAVHTREDFDSVRMVPLGHSFSFFSENEKTLTNHLKAELNYRADLFLHSGKVLHNPALRLIWKPTELQLHFVYSQLLHRFVSVVPEYLAYLPLEKNISPDPVIDPDEMVRTGWQSDFNPMQELRISFGYHYDLYTSRNIADVYTDAGSIHFYRVRNASYDHVAEGKISWTNRHINARVMAQYTLNKARINGRYTSMPFYSPVSALAVFAWKYRESGKSPGVSTTVFYTGRLVSGVDAGGSSLYSRPGFSLNLQTVFPLAYLYKHQWNAPKWLSCTTLTMGCQNLTDHRQTQLYTLSSDGSSANSINPWGQNYGRRWYFGIVVEPLFKKHYQYY